MVGRRIEGSIAGRGKKFSLFHSIQTRVGTHSTFFPTSNEESFPGGDVAGA
jgi:hypothetical protein